MGCLILIFSINKYEIYIKYIKANIFGLANMAMKYTLEKDITSSTTFAIKISKKYLFLYNLLWNAIQ